MPPSSRPGIGSLFHLELGDAVAEQTADPIGTLEHHHGVPRAVELLGHGEAGRPRAHDGDLLARAHGRHLGPDPAVLERVVDDRDLDGLDGDRVVVDAEHARALARRRAEASRELRKVVRRVQPLDGVAPAVLVDEVVPVGDQVAERAALVAEGNATVHAARALLAEILDREGKVDLPPVVHALGDGARRPLLALDLEKAGGLTHSWPRPARRTSARAPRRAPCSPPRARAFRPWASP